MEGKKRSVIATPTPKIQFKNVNIVFTNRFELIHTVSEIVCSKKEFDWTTKCSKRHFIKVPYLYRKTVHSNRAFDAMSPYRNLAYSRAWLT